MNDNKGSNESLTMVEQIVDFSKLNDIKQRKELVYNLFKTNIEFDLTNTKDFETGIPQKSTIYLFGTEKNRADTIKYLKSVCDAEFVQVVKLNDKLTKLLNSNNYQQNLIKNYKVDFEEIPQKLMIKGTVDNVTNVKNIIELNQEALSNGYSIEELEEAFKELTLTNLGKSEFLEYLKSIRNLNRTKPAQNENDSPLSNSKNRNNNLKSNLRDLSEDQNSSNVLQNQLDNNGAKSKNSRPMNENYSKNPNNSNQTNKSNASAVNKETQQSQSDLKFITIDGSNVAREHGKEIGKVFSCKGIKIVVDFFVKRGHKQIKAFVPRFRRGKSDKDCPSLNPEILDELEKNGYLTYTPSRYVENKLIVPYDDRFILQTALHYDGIIVSNDNYRDLIKEKPDWKKHIDNNLLQYSFVGDLFMIADDPMGRYGPKIDEFLKNRTNKNQKSDTKSIDNASDSSDLKVQKNKNQKQQKTSLSESTLNTTNSSKSTLTNAPKISYQKEENENSFSGQNVLNSNVRTRRENTELFKKLKEIFPDSDDIIRALLNQYPNNRDIFFFSSLLVNYSDSNAIRTNNMNHESNSSPEFRIQDYQQQQYHTKKFAQSVINTLDNPDSIVSNASGVSYPRQDNKNSFFNQNAINSNGRDHQKTTQLFTSLNEVFPNSDGKITDLLNQYPDCDDLLFFLNILLNYSESNDY